MQSSDHLTICWYWELLLMHSSDYMTICWGWEILLMQSSNHMIICRGWELLLMQSSDQMTICRGRELLLMQSSAHMTICWGWELLLMQSSDQGCTMTKHSNKSLWKTSFLIVWYSALFQALPGEVLWNFHRSSKPATTRQTFNAQTPAPTSWDSWMDRPFLPIMVASLGGSVTLPRP